MIRSIKMNKVASYKELTSLDTDKKVNLIYGLNGAGKTTISNYLYAISSDKEDKIQRFKDCGMDWDKDNDRLFVYNQEFVQDTFYVNDEISGIFTLSKTNKDIAERIDSLQKEIEDLKKQGTRKKEEIDDFERGVNNEKTNYYEKIWKIKIDHSGNSMPFDFCLEGYKNKKESLFNYINSIEKCEVNYSLEQLKEEINILNKSDNEKLSNINPISNNIEILNNDKLLEKVIVGNDNSSVSEVISRLNNSDWVREGMKYIGEIKQTGTCPFCQKSTITNEFIKNLKNYFDENYEKDLSELRELKNKYDNTVKSLLDSIELLFGNNSLKEYSDDMANYKIKIKDILDANLRELDNKINKPSASAKLNSIEKYIKILNGYIEQANKYINELNIKIDAYEESFKEITKKFWQIMRNDYDNVLLDYSKDSKRWESKLSQLNKDANSISKQIADKENEIKMFNEQMDANLPIDNINNSLLEMGITSFKIKPVDDRIPNKKALYKLVRDNGDGVENENDDVFKTLSEGEKSIISFLYFFELCKGEKDNEISSKNRIVVIDDPISSLSHIFVFNIGRLIKNEFFLNDSFKQVFVLTHSLYFFYEMTKIKTYEKEDLSKLFRIVKNEVGSCIVDMKYNEIQNDYQAYWSIIKDEKQPKALIANCMRNIIEYFFSFVSKADLKNVFQKQEMKNNRFDAFYRYINRESHSDGQNIFDIKEFDYDSFKEAFKQVFVLNGYLEHYEKMMQ